MEQIYEIINNAIISNNTLLRLHYMNIEELPENIFDLLTNVTEIDLYHNSLTQLPENIFKSCASLTELYLGQNKLAKLPENIFRECVLLTKLDLSKNGLLELPENIFESTISLKSIDLCNNDINHLPSTIFSKLSLTELLLQCNKGIDNLSEILETMETESLKIIGMDYKQIGMLSENAHKKISSVEELHLNFCYETDVPDNLLENFTSLKTLNLHHIKLSNISKNLLMPLKDLKTLVIWGNNAKLHGSDPNYADLGEISDDLFSFVSNVESLQIFGMDIHHMPDNIFKPLTSLKSLKITHSIFPNISGKILDIPSLKFLDISYCDTCVLAENIFDSLSNLLTLDISGNKIVDILPNAFESLSNLLELAISGNEIVNILPSTFDSLYNLMDLDLSRNKIVNIPPNLIDSLSSLINLDLSGNKIVAIPPNLFKSLKKLESLSLCTNEIAEISSNVFEGMLGLSYFDIGENILTTLPDNIFKNTPLITTIIICYNKITHLSHTIFEGLTELNCLDLRNNELTEYPKSIFGCGKLRELFLNDNNFVLDVNILRFIERCNKLKHELYHNAENVHAKSIQESTKQSFDILMKDEFMITKNELVEEVNRWPLKYLSSLLIYLDESEKHSVLHISFYEMFVKVFGRIMTSDYKNDMIKRLDNELEDSENKCYTGRFTRMINVLIGYYPDMMVSISDNERISGIIVGILNGNEMTEELREKCKKTLTDAGFTDEIIEEWLNI